ncbi:bifunctional metallophosphatase/5'-nucleotidase [Paludifilum halophilum]|uniref:bifunctional metallophosphatase/5'-nucleotidase n=1 Tax=Paludifilum halophilum TaxID=1642702 RepID=UPI00267BC2A1
MKRQQLVHILHTNDIHSHYEKMPGVQSVIQRLRGDLEDRGEAFFLVDVGDHMDRVRIETEGTEGQANRAVMDATGYQLVTLGNNELLTFSKEDLNALYGDAPFEVLATNVRESGGDRPRWISPWTVREAAGLRIGFLGVTIPFYTFYQLLGWEVADPIERLSVEVPRLRREVDAVVVLSHLGLGNDRRLAEEVPGIDLILGSHTHHLLEVPERIGETLIAAAGKFGGHVGHVTIAFDPATRSVRDVRGGCVSTSEAPADSEIEELIRRFRLKAEEELSRPIVKLDRDLSIDWYQESPLGNLLADGLLEWVGGDCSFVNAGQLLGGLEKGPVTRGQIHRICPHPINPCRMVLTGGQIRRILEESLLREFQEMEIRGFGFRGKRLGMINASGIEIEYDSGGPARGKIRRLWIGGEPLIEKKPYQVATIDMFTFGVGYQEFREGRDLQYFLPEFLRNILASWLNRPEAVDASFQLRWHDIG